MGYKNARATKSQPIGSWYLSFFLIKESETFMPAERTGKTVF